MKFRRRSQSPGSEEGGAESSGGATPGTPADSAEQDTPSRAGWPQDSSEVAEDEELVDLGSLRLRPVADREVRLQVDEGSGTVQAVLLVGPDGAVEVRAFAAPRGGDLWAEVRPEIAAETVKAGGQTLEREGRFGTELLCQRPATTPEGEEAVAPSRVVGITGDRWLLRATFLGRPAMTEDTAEWDDTLAAVVVHRGAEAMPVGEPLPLHLPPQARRVQ